MEKEKQKRKDILLRIILFQIAICSLFLLIIFLTAKISPKNYEEFKKIYIEMINEKINSMQVFKSIKNYALHPMGSAPYKSKFKVSFSPYVTTFKAALPVEGRISSPFGRREDPFTGQDSIHSGLDIACPMHSEIKAVEQGKIYKTGEDEIAGKFIRLRHCENFETFYCHLDKIIAEEGAVVRKGERIALSGSTGLSTGPHLHFEVRIGKEKLDPQRLFKGL